ncbi:hypothetical protein MIMGU_mgv1a021147mg [Erythranthe guttata]|uniref:Uncharacterized protein n=1 Tax=Erythranthe guttata TaxID=4155 RepID=A0A022R0F4_ERYGU|nr:hypothetical protein MIMGU_mgv1a021147mg [Erythranthe guttata]
MAGEAVLGAFVQVLLQNLISISVEQINHVRYYKKQLKKLKDCVSMIQSFLNDAEKKQVTDETVKLWLRKLEGVAFDADNLLDELNYQHLSKKLHTEYRIGKKVRDFIPHSINHLKMALRIRDINKNMEDINHEASNYGLQKAVIGAYTPVDGSGPSAVRLETDSFSIDPIFLGRENDVSKIVKMMTRVPNDQVFSILPIVGMGGLGKSTVARQVFSHEVIRNHFAKRFWVYVSKNFDVMSLFKKILTSLAGTNAELGNKQAVLEELQKYLGTERFLIVLDDVWNDNQEIWDDFVNPLRRISSSTGNGIIVTTRREHVASLVTTLPIHQLNNLLDDECWSIIKAKAVGEGTIIPSELETIGVQIAKRCRGLPLAAKVVAGLLRGKSMDGWVSIQKNWLSDLTDENSISKILKLSFDHLSSPSLKKCFAYCSIFPKGFNMERKKIVELWMAEGFLHGTDMEIVGNQFFDLLLQNSLLLQVVGRNDYYGDITYYNMHDLVHDLASSILISSVQVRYKCLQSSECESHDILNEQASYLRSLLSNDKICVRMFSEFKSLHVLILMGNCVEELPTSIGVLIHLRCLDISDTKTKCFPNSISELYHLQTLRASDVLEALPNTMKNLISLRHLHIPKIELPPEMGRLTSLRTLPYFGVSNEKGCGIGELGSLKNLEGELKIYNLEKVHDKEEAKRADLLQKSNIVKLKLVWSSGNREGENGDESVLEGLQPHANLKSLKICQYRGQSFPSWCSKMSGLNNLIEIRLQHCPECEQVPMLRHLPHLKNLYLFSLKNVQSISSSFYGIDNCSTSSNTITVFPALERLELVEMWKLTEWSEAMLMPNATENQRLSQVLLVVFPRLKYLTVMDCRQLKSAPSHFPCLQELEISQVHSELPLASICGIKLITLTKLKIQAIEGLVCLPDWLFCNNQNLSQLNISDCHNLTHLILSIHDCPNLRELPDDLHNLNALEILRISKCPELKTIPYPHDQQLLLGLSRLHELSITECQRLTNLASEMIESCAPSLEKLELPQLTVNMEPVTGSLQRMSRLKWLTIGDVMMRITRKYGNDEWRILNSSTCSESISVVDAILKVSTKSLCRLVLYGTEQNQDLPEQVQHLNAVSELLLIGLGEMEELPEWFGNNNLSSVKRLCLSHCKIFRRLPSKEAMLRITNLEIYECPLLNVKKLPDGNDGDSEWPKISHIPYVAVDDRIVITTSAH